MKQLRWVWILGIAAVLLIGLFIAVDQRSKKKEEQKSIGGPKQLFSFDGNNITRMTIDNEEGSFDFEWSSTELSWQLVSEEQFEINAYAVAAIADYFSALKSEKTVVFDCTDPSAYGFDHPVAIKVYTTETGSETPYELYVGDCTPTYDAYYAMVGGSDDVFTISYTSGSIFCAAKDTLKNLYLLDTTASLVSYIKCERDGKVTMEMERGSDYLWTLNQPAGFTLMNSRMDQFTDDITRITVTSYVEEQPEDLAKYGLDHPHTKLWLKGTVKGNERSREIWLGDPISSHEDETEIYGYIVEEQQVFTVKRAELAFTENGVKPYLDTSCASIRIEDLAEIEIDMGSVYDLHETLHLDYANTKYSLGDTNISGMKDDEIMTKYTAFYRSIAFLQFSDLDIGAKPDTEKEPDMRITFTMNDGSTIDLTFIEKESNDYYLIRNGKYTGATIRLKSFSDPSSIIESYKALKQLL